jgi:hypothetical protein
MFWTGGLHVLYSLVAIWGIWLVVIIAAGILAKLTTDTEGLLNKPPPRDADEEEREQYLDDKEDMEELVNVTKTLIRKWATAAAVLISIILVLFVYNPFRRTTEELNDTVPVPVPEEHVSLPAEVIEERGTLRVEKIHAEVKEKATEENTAAMNDALELFRNAAESAKAE